MCSRGVCFRPWIRGGKRAREALEGSGVSRGLLLRTDATASDEQEDAGDYVVKLQVLSPYYFERASKSLPPPVAVV